MSKRSFLRLRRLRPALLVGRLVLPLGCAGITAPAHVPPDSGVGVTFSTAEAVQRLELRAVAIDGHMACGPETEAEGLEPCGQAFTTRVIPGRHYLQIQVMRPGESGHDDAEQRIEFGSEPHYGCVVRDVFIKTSASAIDEFGYPEPKVECAPAPAPGVADAPAEGEADPEPAEGEADPAPTEVEADPAPTPADPAAPEPPAPESAAADG